MNALEDRFREVMETLSPLDGRRDSVVFFSGGKDCSALLYLLVKAMPGHRQNALMAVYPGSMYLPDEFARIEAFWKTQDVDLTILTPTEGDPDACHQCKKIRKSALDPEMAKFASSDTVLFSGYTFDDCVAYVEQVQVLTQSTYELEMIPSEQRGKVLSDLVKLQPQQTLDSGYKVCRPLLDIHSEDLEVYLKDNGIPYVQTPCLLYPKKYKRIHEQRFRDQYRGVGLEDLTQLLGKHGIKIPETLQANGDNIDYFSDC